MTMETIYSIYIVKYMIPVSRGFFTAHRLRAVMSWSSTIVSVNVIIQSTGQFVSPVRGQPIVKQIWIVYEVAMLWTFLWRQLAIPFGNYSNLFTELDRGHHSGRYQRTVFRRCSCTKIFSSTHRPMLFDLLLHKFFFILAELQFWKTRFDFACEYFGERTAF